MNQLLIEVEKHASSLLISELEHVYTYHNLSHTQRVVESSKELIESEKINENDAEDLLIAAWFHDTGYIKGVEKHEEQSVGIASKFLKANGVSDEKIYIS